MGYEVMRAARLAVEREDESAKAERLAVLRLARTADDQLVRARNGAAATHQARRHFASLGKRLARSEATIVSIAFHTSGSR